MDTPLISIITVTFNAAEVLQPTLESVEEQTFGDYEHLIVDGASTDGTLELASRFASPRRQVYSRPDKGIYDAMNRGLGFAKGKYVVFLNAGDRFAAPDVLSSYASAMRQEADIVYGDTMIVDSAGNLLGPRHHSAPALLTRQSYLKGMLVCHQAIAVRKEIAPAYDCRYSLSADYDWCLNCIEKSGLMKRINLKRVTIHFLEGGISREKKIKSLKERFLIMRRHFGLGAAIKAHLSFIPRLVKRKLSNKGALFKINPN